MRRQRFSGAAPQAWSGAPCGRSSRWPSRPRISRTPHAAPWRSPRWPRPTGWSASLSLAADGRRPRRPARARSGTAPAGWAPSGIVVSGRRAAGDAPRQRHRAGDADLRRAGRATSGTPLFLIGFLVLVVGSLLLGIALLRRRRDAAGPLGRRADGRDAAARHRARGRAERRRPAHRPRLLGRDHRPTTASPGCCSAGGSRPPARPRSPTSPAS